MLTALHSELLLDASTINDFTRLYHSGLLLQMSAWKWLTDDPVGALNWGHLLLFPDASEVLSTQTNCSHCSSRPTSARHNYTFEQDDATEALCSVARMSPDFSAIFLFPVTCNKTHTATVLCQISHHNMDNKTRLFQYQQENAGYSILPQNESSGPGSLQIPKLTCPKGYHWLIKNRCLKLAAIQANFDWENKYQNRSVISLCERETIRVETIRKNVEQYCTNENAFVSA